eukprot:2404237-Prymnesium_polylepis.1
MCIRDRRYPPTSTGAAATPGAATAEAGPGTLPAAAGYAPPRGSRARGRRGRSDAGTYDACRGNNCNGGSGGGRSYDAAHGAGNDANDDGYTPGSARGAPDSSAVGGATARLSARTPA